MDTHLLHSPPSCSCRHQLLSQLLAPQCILSAARSEVAALLASYLIRSVWSREPPCHALHLRTPHSALRSDSSAARSFTKRLTWQALAAKEWGRRCKGRLENTRQRQEKDLPLTIKKYKVFSSKIDLKQFKKIFFFCLSFITSLLNIIERLRLLCRNQFNIAFPCCGASTRGSLFSNYRE